MRSFKLVFGSLFLLLLLQVSSSGASIDDIIVETEGTEIEGEPVVIPGDPVARAAAMERLRVVGLLIVPDSTADRVMAFDPVTGDLIDANFIPADPTNLSTPVCAIMSPDGSSFLVSDQIEDVVQEYDLNGNYVGYYAPAGGPDTSIMDNIRGIALRPNGNLLVTVGSGANMDAVVEFDTGGNYLGNFITAGAGGLDSPFDVTLRSSLNDYIAAGSSCYTVHQYDINGTYIADLAVTDDFPEQLCHLSNGNFLVADYLGTDLGINEFQSDGTFVGNYNPASLSGYRGVYELQNGNILTSTSSGVYEIDRTGTLIDTKITGVSGRYIEYVATLSDVGDLVWHDMDEDGIQDDIEPGLANITVNLLDAAGAPLDSTLTDANGNYSFIDLQPGDYIIEFIPSANAVFSPANQGGDDSRDSDADQITGRTGIITLINGQIDTSIDCGLYADPLAVELLYFKAMYAQNSVVLTWETLTEIDVLGFNILRSEVTSSPVLSDQKQVNINDAIIPSKGDQLTGAFYEFTDQTAEKGKHYRYTLQSLEVSGLAVNEATTDIFTGRPMMGKK